MEYVAQCFACGEFVDYCQGHGSRYYREFVEYQIAIGNLSPAARDMEPDDVVYQWENYTGETYI